MVGSSSLTFKTVSVPINRALVVDAGILGSKRHIIYGFVEADVTKVKEIRKIEKFSFTSYIAACLSKAVEADPSVQAYTNGCNQLVIFNDVDVVTMIEPSKGAVAIPHIIREANTKSVQDISDEIRSIQSKPESSEQFSGKLIKLAPKIPRWIRMMTFQWLKRNPCRLREKQGTVILTSVGMFGNGGGWGITFLPLHTLGVTIGGITTKPAFADDGVTVVAREYLSITIAFDHDIVDGAPAARFTSRFVDLIESASLVLPQKHESALQNDKEVVIEKIHPE